MNIFFALLSLGFINPPIASADSITPLEYSTSTAELIIEAYAIHAGIPAKPVIDTLRCESGFNKDAVGDHNTSFGVSQIHLPAHPDITKEMALNPYFAISWTVDQFKAGKQSMWTCARTLGYGSNSG